MSDERIPTTRPVPVRIEPATAGDAAAIAAIHVASWRSAYAGILPDRTLLALRRDHLRSAYARRVGRDPLFRVARSPQGVVGFVGATRNAEAPGGTGAGGTGTGGTGVGEIEVLYVLDDWQGRGIGRALARESGRLLQRAGCRRVVLWVVAANPSSFFYEHIGGVLAATGSGRIGGETVPQLLYAWEPIERLADEPPS